MEQSPSGDYQKLVRPRPPAGTRSSSIIRQQSELIAAVGAQVYRELHGVLGEGRGQFEQGMHVLLCIINANNETNILDRLKVPACRCVVVCRCVVCCM